MSRSIDDPRLKAGDRGTGVVVAVASVLPTIIEAWRLVGLIIIAGIAGTGGAAAGELVAGKGDSSRASPEVRRFFAGRLSSSSSVSSGSVLRTNESH